MSGIGLWELIILFLIGLIVLGPERLPAVARQLGDWLGQARRMTRVMRRQLEDELDLNKPLNIQPQKTTPAPGASKAADASIGEGDVGDEPPSTDEDVIAARIKAAHDA